MACRSSTASLEKAWSSNSSSCGGESTHKSAGREIALRDQREPAAAVTADAQASHTPVAFNRLD
jgi:hypothetical protein